MLALAGIPHRTEEAKGRATEVLVQRREDSQLLVLGSRVARACAGSTASSVARAADATVLLAP